MSKYSKWTSIFGISLMSGWVLLLFSGNWISRILYIIGIIASIYGLLYVEKERKLNEEKKGTIIKISNN